MYRKSLFGALGVLALGCVVTSPAHANLFRAGTLLCFSSARVGLIVGSTQTLRCEFHKGGASRRYIYTGRIRRIGLDIGATQGGVLSWVVLAHNSRIGPGTLRGTYVGASGSVAFGLGLGANVLVGGSRQGVVLQPVSVERNVGINLAAGVTSLSLGARGRR
jgi:hypothetical protein